MKKKHHKERRDGRKSKSRHSSPEVELSGIISVTSSGYGFVAPQPPLSNKKDIFIPAAFMNGAMDRDEVGIRMLPPRDAEEAAKGPAGEVVKIIKRGREKVVGELLAGHRVRPLNRKVGCDVDISGVRHGAKRGDWVQVKVLEYGNKGSYLGGKISKVVGRANTIAGDLDAVMAEFNLKDPYTEEEERCAAALPEREIQREICPHRLCVTIDPVDAKDYDDAISIDDAKEAGFWEIGVHISDVAAWIAPGERFDRQAAKRGFTAYLPGRTLPMLPRNLTAKISLQPDREMPAHTVYFVVDKVNSEVKSIRRVHTKVRITSRLNYDEAQKFIDNPEERPHDLNAEHEHLFHALALVARDWRKYRVNHEEFLDLDLPELRVLCDEGADRINGIERRQARESEMLVEEYMLAANVAVAREMQKRGIPGIYRVHDEPDPEKLEEFRQLAQEAFKITTGDLSIRRNVCAFLKKLEGNPRRQMIVSAFLRSLPRAGYEGLVALHYGLNKLVYAHFTSPIRRYPDLVVHQQLWCADENSRWRSENVIKVIAQKCTDLEENNDNAYFMATDRLKLRYLDEQLADGGRENLHEALIVRILPDGLLVEVSEWGVYGIVESDLLPGDYRRVGNTELRRANGRQSYCVGDYIFLLLDHIDFAQGTAYFRPAR